MTSLDYARRSPSHEVAAAHEATVAQVSDFMEAVGAAYALMAHADGEASRTERRCALALLRDHPAMSVFSYEEIAEEIAVHEANFRFDPELAQQIAREKLVPIIGQGRAVRTILKLCRDIIPADGIAHPAEYRMLHELKALLLGEQAVERRR